MYKSLQILFTLISLFLVQLIFAQSFRTTWKTDNTGTSSNTSITIPTFAGETYLYNVDWNDDGTFDEFGLIGDTTHDFGSIGNKTIRIEGVFPRIHFNNGGDKEKLIFINAWGNQQWASMDGAFHGCINMNSIAIDTPNLTNTTSMLNMFNDCESFDADINLWNVSNVSNMNNMFQEATAFNQDISGWQVSNVNSMSNMFQNATSFDQNLGSWNIGNLSDASNMFNGITLSTSNYDALLIGWQDQTHNIITFSGGNSLFCAGATSRQSLVNEGWIISDSGETATCSNTYFVTQWDTNNTGTTNSTSIKIPTEGTGYHYDVDWEGDGVFDEFGLTGDVTHDYGSIGSYTVKIRGQFPRIFFNDEDDKEKIIFVNQWGAQQWTSMENAFQGCSNFLGSWADLPDLSNVTNMSSMFSGATVFNQSLAGWDMSNVTNMSNMFKGATAFNQNIDIWDISNVTDLSSMFSGATVFNQSLASWDTNDVTNMSNMFKGATVFNQNIGGWSTNYVTDMSNMFNGATAFNQNIGGWSTDFVTDMSNMFNGASAFNQDIGGWNTMDVTDMSNMFNGATAFNQNIGGWNTNTVTDMSSMFSIATAFNQNIGGWFTNNVTDMSSMFSFAIAFNQNIGGWNTGSVTNMESMFTGISFNQDLSSWDTGIVTNMENMFANTTSFNQNIGAWNVSNLSNATNMFGGVTLSTINYDALLLGWESQTLQSGVVFSGGNSQYCAGASAKNTMSTIDTWSITDGGETASCSNTHFVTTWQTNNTGTSNNTSITIPTAGGIYNYDVDWNNDGTFDQFGITGSVIHDYGVGNEGVYTIRIRGLFPSIFFNDDGDKEKIISVDQWGTQQWTTMYSAFFGCSNLNGSLIDNPDLSNVTDMRLMFSNATSFNQDIGAWDTGNVTDMSLLFYNTTSFNQNLGNWDTSSVLDMSNMFHNASIFNQDIGSWVTTNVTRMSQMFRSAFAFNQDIGSWDTANVTNMSQMFTQATVFNQDIGSWVTSSLNIMNGMFSEATAFNQNIGSWVTGNVSEMSGVFLNAINFNQDIGGWNTGNVTNMEGAFQNATSFDQDLGLWNITSLTNATNMFNGVTLSTTNYDALLIGWESQVYVSGVTFHGGNSEYCIGETARGILSADSWVILDGGTAKPDVDTIAPQTECASYTLPGLTDGNYFTGTGGTGTSLSTGDVLTTSQTIYIYADNGICTDETSFTLTIIPLPPVDTMISLTECASYILPGLTDGNYFTGTGGTGTALFAGDNITTTQTIYIYANNGTCTDETSFTVTIDTIPLVDTMTPQNACESYELPILTNGNYYTGTGGTGTALFAGDSITSTQIIYIYAVNGTCNNETNFTVTIDTIPPVDTMLSLTECVNYILPALTNGNYFTGTGGTGTALFVGDIIPTTQTIYIYAVNGTCTDETNFSVTIDTMPLADTLLPQTECDNYTLPTLINGTYYTGTGGTGTILSAGDTITTTQTIYIYAINGTCSIENSFLVTINALPPVDTIVPQTSCDNYILPVLSNGAYFTETDGAGTALFAGDSITSSQTIYIYADNGDCTNETNFSINIITTPLVDTILPQIECDSYTLPILIEGAYFTGTGGTGTALFAGDSITSSQTIYIYAANGICNNETNFTVTINYSPNIDIANDVSDCDSYSLPSLLIGNYFTETGGTGTALFAEDIITETQTVYIYGILGVCEAESSFIITINETPIVETLEDVEINVAYELPVLMDGSYFTLPNGQGTQYEGGEDIFQSQVLYIYAETDTDPNCFTESSFEITIIPNVDYMRFFTPNGNGENDYWQILGKQKVASGTLIDIFDRDGRLLARIDPYGQGWDGKYKGQPLPSSEYWFRARLVEGKTMTASFSLLRK